MDSALAAYYQQMTWVHGVSGLIARVGLLALIALVAMGNRKPGHLLLTLALGLQLVLASFLAFDSAYSESFAAISGSASLPVGVLTLIAVVLLLVTLRDGGPAWNTRHPGSDWQTWLGWGLIAWGLWYPVTSDGPIAALWQSPMAAIPQPTFFVLLGLLLMKTPGTAPDRNITLGIAAVAIAQGLLDVLSAELASSLLLVLAAGIVALLEFRPMRDRVIQSDIPEQSDDEPSPPRPRAAQPPARTTPRPAPKPTPRESDTPDPPGRFKLK